MTKEQKAWLDMEDVDDGTTEKDYTVNTIKSICILSHYPFFDTFEKFLRYLHKVAHSGPYPVPLERFALEKDLAAFQYITNQLLLGTSHISCTTFRFHHHNDRESSFNCRLQTGLHWLN